MELAFIIGFMAVVGLDALARFASHFLALFPFTLIR
jgi:hypothetical protein